MHWCQGAVTTHPITPFIKVWGGMKWQAINVMWCFFLNWDIVHTLTCWQYSGFTIRCVLQFKQLHNEEQFPLVGAVVAVVFLSSFTRSCCSSGQTKGRCGTEPASRDLQVDSTRWRRDRPDQCGEDRQHTEVKDEDWSLYFFRQYLWCFLIFTILYYTSL